MKLLIISIAVLVLAASAAGRPTEEDFVRMLNDLMVQEQNLDTVHVGEQIGNVDSLL